MSESTTLPLPLAELPESLHRFADPKAPGPARLMAAKGLVPIKGGDLVTLMVQLASDADANIASAPTPATNSDVTRFFMVSLDPFTGIACRCSGLIMTDGGRAPPPPNARISRVFAAVQ